jgi:PAS domain S-box-containing protein
MACYSAKVTFIKATRSRRDRRRDAEASAQRFAVLEEVAQRSPDFIVIIDEAGTVVYANPVALQLFGISLEQSLGTRAFRYIHPDDARRIARRFFMLARIPGASMSDEVRVVVEDGTTRDLEIVTTNCLDHPDVAGIVVNGRDVSERREYVRELEVQGEWHRTLAANSSHITLVLERDGTILYAGPSNVNVTGREADERVGRSVFEFVHHDDFESCHAAFRRSLDAPGTQRPEVFRFYDASGETRSIEFVLTNRLDDPSIHGIVVNANDVTEVTNLTRALQTLSQGNQIMVRASDEETLLSDVCAAIISSGAYQLAWVGLAENDEEKTVRPVMSSGRTKYLDEVTFSWGDNELGQGTTGTAIRTGTTQVVTDIRHTKVHTPWLEPARRYGFRTGCAFPLIVAGVTIGALTIYAAQPGVFGPAEVELLSELADDLAYGIGRLRDAARLSDHDALLRESEERFRLAFEQNMAPMLFVDLEDRVITANDAFTHLIGYSQALYPPRRSGHHRREPSSSNDRRNSARSLRQALPTKRRSRGHCRGVTFGGSGRERHDALLRHL